MNSISPNRCVRAGAVLTSALVSAFCISSQAYAQAWLPDRAYTEGPGIRAGDLEVHPGIAVRGGYDTNVFRADGDSRIVNTPNGPVDVTQEEQGAGILAVTPHLHLSTLSLQRQTQGEDRPAGRHLPTVAFRGGLAATYLHYFLEGAPKNVEFDTDLWLGILPYRPFNVDVSLAYARHVRPFTQYAGDKNAYNYNVVRPRVRLNFGSRSQVLTGYVGYAPSATLYESRFFNYLNNFVHGVEAGGAWRFLPNTALISDLNFAIQRYTDENPTETVSPIIYADNDRFRARLGINGAFTRRLSLRVLAGYALIHSDVTNIRLGLDPSRFLRLDDHEDIVGEAVLGLAFGPGQAGRFEIGYQRDLASSALGAWVLSDRGFATLRALLGRVFSLSLEGAVAHLKYGSLWGRDARFSMGGSDNERAVGMGRGESTDRDDIRVEAALRGEYRITSWLALMADLSIQTVITDFEYQVQLVPAPGQPGQTVPVSGVIYDPGDYFTLMAFGGIRVHY